MSIDGVLTHVHSIPSDASIVGVCVGVVMHMWYVCMWASMWFTYSAAQLTLRCLVSYRSVSASGVTHWYYYSPNIFQHPTLDCTRHGSSVLLHQLALVTRSH
jgi:hypothetical protein